MGLLKVIKENKAKSENADHPTVIDNQNACLARHSTKYNGQIVDGPGPDVEC